MKFYIISKNIVKFFTITLLFLISFEFSLRLVGVFLNLDQTLDNFKNNIGNDNRYRILCIGESTTASYFADSIDTSWPKLLEKLLNENANELGFKSIVFNEGVPGTNTKLISLNLEDLIKKYKPDMVISMMGINDSGSLLGIEKLPHSELILFLTQLKTYKVLNYFFPNSLINNEIKSSYTEPSIEFNLSKKLDIFLEKDSHLNTESLLQFYGQNLNQLTNARDKGNYHQFVGSKIHIKYMNSLQQQKTDSSLLDLCYDYLEKTFKVSEMNDLTIYRMTVCARNSQLNLKKVIQLTLRILKYGYTLNSQTLAIILQSKDMFTESQFDEFLKLNNLGNSKISNYKWSTQENYNYVYNVLKKNNIFYVSMMYPSGNVEQLKKMYLDTQLPDQTFINFMYTKSNPEEKKILLDDNKMLFVSNENFSTECKEVIGDCYIDLWTKSIGGSFGHTTTKGHLLIAKNIFNTLIKNKEKLQQIK